MKFLELLHKEESNLSDLLEERKHLSKLTRSLKLKLFPLRLHPVKREELESLMEETLESLGRISQTVYNLCQQYVSCRDSLVAYADKTESSLPKETPEEFLEENSRKALINNITQTTDQIKARLTKSTSKKHIKEADILIQLLSEAVLRLELTGETITHETSHLRETNKAYINLTELGLIGRNLRCIFSNMRSQLTSTYLAVDLGVKELHDFCKNIRIPRLSDQRFLSSPIEYLKS